MSLGTRKLPPNAGVLRALPGFAGIGRRDLARLALLFDDVGVPAGAVLTREGRPCYELLLLVEGAATLTVRGRPVGAIGPGGVLGETAVLGHDMYRATATTRTPARVLVAGCGNSRALRDEPAILRLIARDLARRLSRDERGAPAHAAVGQAGTARWRLTG